MSAPAFDATSDPALVTALTQLVADLLSQAEERQKSTPSLHYCGTLLQHLVGAALAELIERYNRIVGEIETDPSLRIELLR